MRAKRLAVLATGLSLLAGSAGAKEPATFMGFRLLNLESQQVKWQDSAIARTPVVTYALATDRVETPGARNCASMLPPERAYEPSHISTEAFRAEVAAAFRMWEKVADIKFRETRDPTTAGIVIGAQAVPLGRAFTNVELKPVAGNAKKTIGRSLICLNPKQPWKIGFDGRLGVYDLRYTMAHEIGHAIGLDHPSASGQLMSYRYDEKHVGLQQGDIQGAVALYGARPATQRFATAGAADTTTGAEPQSAEPDGSWPFGIGTKRAGAGPQPLHFPDATGSISPRP